MGGLVAMSGRQRLAREGEELAARYLRARGLKILARNWRGRCGELDLVCADGATLVFVEVKARASSNAGDPEQAVDARKRAKLRRVAEEYLAREVQGEPPCRFDVVAVNLRPGGQAELRHLAAVDV